MLYNNTPLQMEKSACPKEAFTVLLLFTVSVFPIVRTINYLSCYQLYTIDLIPSNLCWQVQYFLCWGGYMCWLVTRKTATNYNRSDQNALHAQRLPAVCTLTRRWSGNQHEMFESRFRKASLYWCIWESIFSASGVACHYLIIWGLGSRERNKITDSHMGNAIFRYQ